MKQRTGRFGGGGGKRRDRLIQDARHDTYRARRKPAELTVCPDCGSEVYKGRWRWATRPFGARSRPCPACQRIRDGCPAGEVVLRGDFVASHRREITNLARNVERLEKGEHPLVRIMDTRPTRDGMVITTTDEHLARRIGDALHKAYSGELSRKYAPGEKYIRVCWSR